MNQHDNKVLWYFDVERLDAYRVAKELLREVVRVSKGWHGFSDLREQARTAASSVVLNLAEGAGQPRGSGNKRRHFGIAMGSTGEVFSAVDAAKELELEVGRCIELARRTGALVGGLLRACR